MRPSRLNPLFAAVTTLTGVGPQLERLYRRLFGREQPARVIDLLFHLPTGAIDRRARPKLRIGRARPIRSTPATRPATSR
jgi:ATP-dependent DNA helicase RecG